MLVSSRRDPSEFRKRFGWMTLAVIVAFFALWVQLIRLQVFESLRYARIAQDNITRTVWLPATRGVIQDRKGRVLATNRPAYQVYVTPQLIKTERDFKLLFELLKFGVQEQQSFRARLAAVPAYRSMQQIRMLEDLNREQLANLETHRNELSFLEVVAVPQRNYPYHELGAHAVGYLNEVNADDLKRYPKHTYRAGDVIGRSGVERALESVLRGQQGVRRVWIDSKGRPQTHPIDRRLGEYFKQIEPKAGSDVTLTLDMDLMSMIDKAFRPHPAGAAIVVEVQTGRVLAMYAKPAYDLNAMVRGLTQQEVDALNKNPYRPLIDKTLYESYFPGSIFKPVSALAALDAETISPQKTVKCTGFYELGHRKFRCTQVHREVNLQYALIQSCNVYFYRLAEQTGLDKIAEYARIFGLGERTDIGINTESAGFVPTKSWYLNKYKNNFRVGYALNAAIGQGDLRATLIQLAMMYAALANGGALFVPQLVESVRDVHGAIVRAFSPKLRRQLPISKAHLDMVVEGLVGVVNNKKGTAYDARGETEIVVAGKTGTAQVTRKSSAADADGAQRDVGKDDAWFAGFAPADQPSIAMVAVVENAGGGGKYAAPIVVSVLEKYLSGL